MTALLLPSPADFGAIADDAIMRLAKPKLATNGWPNMATRRIVNALLQDNGNPQPFRIVNVIRSVAHSPTAHDMRVVTDAAFDAVAARYIADAEGDELAAFAKLRELRAVAKVELDALEIEQCSSEVLPLEATRVAANVARVVALRDRELAGHMESTGALAGRIARRMGLPPQNIRLAEVAGSIHNVGMLAIDYSSANEQYSGGFDLDFATRAHVEIGEAYVLATPGLEVLAPIVRAHHEHFDGTGYPDRLAGEAIPIEARIIAVAATFLTLVFANQGSRFAAQDALGQLAARANNDFDPAVVSVTNRVVGLRVRRQSA